MTFQEFYSAYNGKSVEVEDSANFAQCMDLAFRWVDNLGIPRDTIRHLYAYQVYTMPFDSTKARFDIIPNGPTNMPTVGDLVVFGQSVGYAGHISIAAPGSTGKDLNSFDQNWGYPKTCRIVTHWNYGGVLGWLHPKTPSTVITDRQALQQIRVVADSSDGGDNKVFKIKEILGKVGV